MARDERFWHPTRNEWKWLCEVRDDLDPNNTLFTKDGDALAIWMADKPTEDIARGRAIAEKREADKQGKLRQEMARSEEEMEKSMLSRERHRQALVREFEKRPERSRIQSEKQSLKRKAFTADDPFEASVLNAVDKDQRAKNGNLIIHARRLSDLPKVALSDPEAIRERVDWYFQLCVTDGVRPNLPGLALAFGLTRTGLMNALADRRMTRACAEEIGRGIAMMDEILSAMTLAGQVNPVAAIYFMNNWLGYKNASEVTTKTEGVENNVDQKALEQKYNSVVDVE
jgi:hypothetical protein